MNIIQRVIQSLSAAPRLAVKATPYLFNYAKNNPLWQMVDYLAYVNEGYERNALIYAAIMYKVRAINSTRIRAYRGDPEQPQLLPDNHPLAKLLARPNRHQSWLEFEGLNEVFFNIAGNSYIYLERSKPGALPVAMYPLRPDRVRIIPGEREIAGYLYIPQGETVHNGLPILPEDIIHIKLPNPGDELEGMGYGLSPLTPLARSADVDNNVTKYLKLFFEQGTVLSGYLKINNPIDEQESERIKALWRKKYGGVANWADILVLDADASYQQLGQTFKDMDFSTIDERNEMRMLGPLGVPAILLPTRSGMKNSTYANMAEARKAFWEDTMLFELRIFDVEYAHYLSVPDAFIQRDLSDVPALQRNVPELIDAALKLWSMGVPANLAVRTVGLMIDDIPDGDIAYIPANMLPAGQPQPDAANPPKQLPAPLPRLPRKSRWSAEEKAALWQKGDSIARAWEGKFGDAAAESFERDRRAIQTIINTAKQKAWQQKATINWLSLSNEITAYLSDVSPAGWRDTFVPAFAGLVQETGNFWAAELGFTWNVRNLLGEQWFAEYTLQFAQPINATSSNVIQTILAQAQAEGWSIFEMTEHLDQLFDQWIKGDLTPEDFAWLTDRAPFWRRELIARTETTRLQNTGSFQLFKSWDVPRKEWNAAIDRRTRDTHLGANGQIVGIDEPFRVGGFDMMHPGDMSLGAPLREIADCRCAVLPDID